MSTRLTRRAFLASATAAGAALTIRFPLVAPGDAAAAAAYDPNAALTITPDGIVTVHITKAEMGQGVGTALAQIVAEELEVDWKDVRVDYPANDPKFGLMLTGGSWSVNWTFDTLSRAGAAARLALIDAAAKTWNANPADCVAARGVVRHLPTGRALRYGEIVARVPITKTFSEDELKQIVLKKPADYRVVGQWIPRLDIPEKTNGKAKFGIDTFLPNMVYAKVAYPPTREGAKFTAVDDSAAKRVKGYVATVQLPQQQLVAVVASSYEAAVKARDALKVSWDAGPNASVSTDSIFAKFNSAKDDPGVTSWHEQGDVKGAMGGAARRHEATYTTDYVAHMQMEPMNCVVRFADGAYDIYTGSQFQTFAVGTLAATLGVDASKIRINQQYLGGGFGRRLEADGVARAVEIARHVDGPVKVVWTREEDIQHDMYRPYWFDRLSAGLDAKGRPVAWNNRFAGSSVIARWLPPGFKNGLDPDTTEGAIDLVYDLPNLHVEYVRVEPPGIPTAFWRSVGPSHTVFVVESFMDELAAAAKQDAVAYRLALLDKAPRAKAVLALAAQKAGWGQPRPKGSGCGVSLQHVFATYMAVVAEVEVAKDGTVRVRRVVCAVDCGTVVNPDTVRAQIQSAIMFGVTAALFGEITLKDGRVEQANFDTYQILRMNEAPAVEVHIVQNFEPPGGMGECGTSAIVPAVSNAIFAATGKRLRKMPVDAAALRQPA